MSERELTPREREVLDLIRRGLTNYQIGRELGISDKTARNHISSVFEKLGVADRAEAAAHGRDALERIARAAADIANTFYEFEGDAESLAACLSEPMDHLDDLLVEAGYRPPPPPPPTPEEIDAWIVERVRANGGEPIPELLPPEEPEAIERRPE